MAPASIHAAAISRYEIGAKSFECGRDTVASAVKVAAPAELSGAKPLPALEFDRPAEKVTELTGA